MRQGEHLVGELLGGADLFVEDLQEQRLRADPASNHEPFRVEDALNVEDLDGQFGAVTAQCYQGVLVPLTGPGKQLFLVDVGRTRPALVVRDESRHPCRPPKPPSLLSFVRLTNGYVAVLARKKGCARGGSPG